MPKNKKKSPKKQLLAICILILYSTIVQVTSREHFIIIYLCWCSDMTYSRILWRRFRSSRWAWGNSLNFHPCKIMKIIDDSNLFSVQSSISYRTLTFKLITLLWPFPRCNEDPDCRNPRSFRIAWPIESK